MSYLIIIFLFILGAIMGSFFAVVATRVPKNESIISPRSHCEFCNHVLSYIELIPIFSYIYQKGKCRNCGKKLSLSYLATELASGILFVLSYLKFGFSLSFFLCIILSSLVIIIFVSDMKYMIILDSPLIISAILIIFFRFIFQGFTTTLSFLIDGTLTLLCIFYIGKLGNLFFKRESLGGGDIKLAFIMGLALGFPMAMISFVLSTFLALPYAITCMFLNLGHEVPFGPFLGSSLWIVFFFFEKFQYILTLLFPF